MASSIRIQKKCHFCGNDFIAKTTKTKFCSHKCACDENKALKRGIALKKPEMDEFPQPYQDLIPIIKHKDILSLNEAAKYMGIGKTTVYRYCVENKLKCLKINRKIFIRKQDIHAIFDRAEDYEVVKQQPRKPITEFYTAQEIAEKYGYCKDAVHRYCKSKKVPAVRQGQFYYYSKTHVDKLYSLRKPDEVITEWYYTAEIMSKYSLSKNAVYSLTSENAVPKKNDKGKTLYSKKHVDALLSQRDISEIDPDMWYTVAEIVMKYDKPRGWIANFVHKKGITKTKRGNIGYYLREEFDAEYSKAFPPQEWYSVGEVMDNYNLTQDSVYAFLKRYSIPTEKEGSKIRISKNHIDKYFNYSFL